MYGVLAGRTGEEGRGGIGEEELRDWTTRRKMEEKKRQAKMNYGGRVATFTQQPLGRTVRKYGVRTEGIEWRVRSRPVLKMKH
jgi:hypothetical protein